MRVQGKQLKFLLPLVLALLLVILQYELWFGEGDLSDAWRLQRQVSEQKAENIELMKRNQALTAQVQDLKQGQAAVEEQARTDLGMIKKGETFYQIVREPAAPPKQ
ncbi:MAG: cell division protein FtsB [Gammaproteobacteria bacterium]|nr:cell division protein FtsB [Gammaproteobacteria bacterium]MDE2346439.1 cell division protein FtsB [Gammaproteobacteria bacterium]